MSVTIIDSILGKTAKSIEGFAEGSTCAVVHFVDGSKWLMRHEADCCETVDVASIDGDPDWLVGKPLIVAEIVDNVDQPPAESWAESYTWTFVKLGTNAGVITVRWYGSSNGFYCERPQTRYCPVEVAQ